VRQDGGARAAIPLSGLSGGLEASKEVVAGRSAALVQE
jgi:hypothetical protein